jgi:osmotically-inducible protein OsmY
MKNIYALFLTLLLLQMTGCASMVAGGLAKGGYQSSPQDRETTARVEQHLKINSRLDVSRIRVNTYQGTVTLNGNVDSSKSERAAVEITSRVRGVKRVVSRLTISTN